MRTRLLHETPRWVEEGALFFVTVCAKKRGVNTLCRRPVAEKLAESVGHRVGLGLWEVPLLLLMPDHIHVLMRGASNEEMAPLVTAWKRYAARTCGVRWQRGFFDHRVRSDEHLRRIVAYIEANPVRAGLIVPGEAWPYVWRW